MPYNNLIQRSDVAGRIPEDISSIMLKNLSAASSALSLGYRIPLPAATSRFPVLAALPVAYWVNGDTGLKQTSTASWDKKFIDVEELAVIVPIPEAVLDDSGFDVWEEIRPLMEGAIVRALDDAIFLGVSAPAAFPEALAIQAANCNSDALGYAGQNGNQIVLGTSAMDAGGIALDISNAVAILEEQGFMPDGAIAKVKMRGAVRNLAAVPFLTRPGNVITPEEWLGAPVQYPMRGMWPTGDNALTGMIGDFGDNLVIGVRQDFEYKILDQGVITDDTNAIIFNLPQQDMVAMRLTFRAGWQVANTINYDQPDPTKRFPVCNLIAGADGSI